MARALDKLLALQIKNAMPASKRASETSWLMVAIFIYSLNRTAHVAGTKHKNRHKTVFFNFDMSFPGCCLVRFKAAIVAAIIIFSAVAT